MRVCRFIPLARSSGKSAQLKSVNHNIELREKLQGGDFGCQAGLMLRQLMARGRSPALRRAGLHLRLKQKYRGLEAGGVSCEGYRASARLSSQATAAASMMSEARHPVPTVGIPLR